MGTVRRVAAVLLLAGLLVSCTANEEETPTSYVEPSVTFTLGANGKPGAVVDYTCFQISELGDCRTEIPADGREWVAVIRVKAHEYVEVKVAGPGSSCWIRSSDEGNKVTTRDRSGQFYGHYRDNAWCTETMWGQEGL